MLLHVLDWAWEWHIASWLRKLSFYDRIHYGYNVFSFKQAENLDVSVGVDIHVRVWKQCVPNEQEFERVIF